MLCDQGGYHYYDVVRVASVSVAFGVSIPPGSSLAAVAGPVTNALAQLLATRRVKDFLFTQGFRCSDAGGATWTSRHVTKPPKNYT